MKQRQRYLDIISKFSESTVMVIGDLMIDHFIWGVVDHISPEAPVPVVEVQRESIMLGGAANVINNVMSIGGNVIGVGVAGDDDTGLKLRRELLNKGMNVKIIVDKDRPTTLKTRVVAHSQQLVRFDRESKKTISEEHTKCILDYVCDNINKIGSIIISDYNKGLISLKLIDGIKKVTHNKNIPICVDPKHPFSYYEGVDVITPNIFETRRGLNISINNEQDIIEAGNQLIRDFNFKSVVITRGEDGLSIFSGYRLIEHTHLPTKAKEVYDVTGAGDTVIGVIALSLAAGANIFESAVLSNHAAGIVVGKIGTATVSQKELKQTLS